jgi:6-pyruvoyl-tetrahydropterin synthase
MPEASIYVRHNAEIAHRLSQLPGKCQNIHGHSLQIELTLTGATNEEGILAGLDFASVKAAFRYHLDSMYDHRLLLNQDDPWAESWHFESSSALVSLPGLRTCEGDPTTENIARWICEWAMVLFSKIADAVTSVTVCVRETNTNGATYFTSIHS